MNGRKARAIRKRLFKDKDFRNRKYIAKETGQIINLADPLKDKKGLYSLRQIYQHIKLVSKGKKIKDLDRVIKNEEPQSEVKILKSNTN